MRIDKVNQSIVQGIQQEDRKQMVIDDASIQVLQHILSEGLYEDPITAAIAETVNNAIDAVTDAGKNPVENPVLVKLYEENGQDFLSVEDKGIGLNKEEFADLIGSYLKSTKRESNNSLGYFGLGKFAPLSYVNSFYWVCRKDGIETKYMLYRGESFTEYTELYSEATSEENGTTVIIPVESDDVGKFRNKINKKLSYYDTVVIEIYGELLNDYKIYRHEEFQYSTLYEHDNFHLCLRDVYYEIDWEKLDMSPVPGNIGLRFSLDEGLVPTPSREGIIYSKESVAKIKEKLIRVCSYLVSEYNKSTSVVENVVDSIELFNQEDKYHELPENFINVTALHPSTVDVKYPAIEGISELTPFRIYQLKDDMRSNYFIYGSIYNRVYKNANSKSIKFNDVVYEYPRPLILIHDEKPKGLQMEFIKDKYSNCCFVKRYDYEIPLEKDGKHWNSYRNMLGFPDMTKESSIKQVEEVKLLLTHFDKKLIDVNDLKPTEEWLEERKKNRRRVAPTQVENTEINPAWGRRPSVDVSGCYCVFKKDAPIEIEDLDFSKVYIYTNQEGKKGLNKLFSIIGNDSKTEVMILPNRDIKKVKNCEYKDNFIDMEEFMEGVKYKKFGDYCTAAAIQDFMIPHRYLIDKYINFIGDINEEFYDTWLELKNWKRDITSESYLTRRVGHSEILDDMLAICKEKDLWNTEKMEKLNQLKAEVHNFEFLKSFSLNEYYIRGNKNTDTKQGEAIKFARKCYEAFRTEYQPEDKTKKIEQYAAAI